MLTNSSASALVSSTPARTSSSSCCSSRRPRRSRSGSGSGGSTAPGRSVRCRCRHSRARTSPACRSSWPAPRPGRRRHSARRPSGWFVLMSTVSPVAAFIAAKVFASGLLGVKVRESCARVSSASGTVVAAAAGGQHRDSGEGNSGQAPGRTKFDGHVVSRVVVDQRSQGNAWPLQVSLTPFGADSVCRVLEAVEGASVERARRG